MVTIDKQALARRRLDHLIAVGVGEERVLRRQHGATDEDAGQDHIHEVRMVNDSMTANAKSANRAEKAQHKPLVSTSRQLVGVGGWIMLVSGGCGGAGASDDKQAVAGIQGLGQVVGQLADIRSRSSRREV